MHTYKEGSQLTVSQRMGESTENRCWEGASSHCALSLMQDHWSRRISTYSAYCRGQKCQRLIALRRSNSFHCRPKCPTLVSQQCYPLSAKFVREHERPPSSQCQDCHARSIPSPILPFA